MESQGTPGGRRRLLTVDDVAEIFCLQPKTIRCWVERREVPFVRVGHNVRFRPEIIDAMIERGEVRPLRRRRAESRTMHAAD